MLPPTPDRDPQNPDRDPKKPSLGRIAIWLGVIAVGGYFVISGIIGVLTPG